MRRENDKFHFMYVFHEVANQGSFTKAAEALEMTTSSVSKVVSQLEKSLAVKLLNRTTRHQSLTDSGRIYLNYAQQMLAQFKEMEQRVQGQHIEPAGILRVAMPSALGQFFLAPKLHEFTHTYPKINIELVLTEGIVDISAQGFDLAVQSVDVATTSSLYSIKIGQHTQKLVATPEYIASNALVSSPEQLHQVNLLTYKGPQISPTWRFMNNDVVTEVLPNSTFCSNSYYALLMAAKNGQGVANLYQYMIDDEIERGNLVELLPQWQQTSRDRYAVFQQRRDSSPKLDLFIKFLMSLFH